MELRLSTLWKPSHGASDVGAKNQSNAGAWVVIGGMVAGGPRFVGTLANDVATHRPPSVVMILP